MTTTARNFRRVPSVRRVTVIGAAAATAVAGVIGLSGAANAAPATYATQMSCTTMNGRISYQPGLINGAARNVNATLTGTLAGCSSQFGGSYADQGTINAQLSGKTTAKAESLSGSFVINWPASSGLNPSVGTLTIQKSGTSYTVQGYTSSTTGAWEGSLVNSSYVVTGQKGRSTRAHPLMWQSFVNSLPLTVSHNIG